MKKGPTAVATLHNVRRALERFHRILADNNRILEVMGQMDEARGGEYLYDRSFLRQSAKRLTRLVREVIVMLNTLTGNRYAVLYDRFTEITEQISALAEGDAESHDMDLVLPLHRTHLDLDHLTGAKCAMLGEAAGRLALDVPDGFVITAAAFSRILTETGAADRIDALSFSEHDQPAMARAAVAILADIGFPDGVTDAIATEWAALRERRPGLAALAVRSSGVGEDEEHSFAGQFLTVLHVPPRLQEILSAYRQVLQSRFSARVLDYLGRGISARELPMAVIVQEMVRPDTGGVLYTMDPAAPDAEYMVINAVAGSGASLVDGSTPSDRYLVERRHPFSPVLSDIGPRLPAASFPGGDDSGLRPGSALLHPGDLARLAEMGMFLEKNFNQVLDLEWAMVAARPVLLQCRPLEFAHKPPPPEEVAAAVSRAKILFTESGQAVQLGIAAGQVVHVSPEDDASAFPVGAVAVAAVASPRLSPVVRRAAAIITEIGSPAGHLATIAREYRTPALFGATGARQALLPGALVTVDVEARTVYQGCVETLVNTGPALHNVHLRTPEARSLRRMLRWITPLSLTDPDDPGFRTDNCRTLHDIIRFCHEKAVAALVDWHEKGAALGEAPSLPLELSLPISIRVIDLGDGLMPARGKNRKSVQLPEVASRPFRAFLQGLLQQNVWDQGPAPFGIMDLISSISRPLAHITNPPAFTGINLAILAADYFNLSLRLGYHFNVIDAFLTETVEDNYIYFRFAGGFAQPEKRRRRAELIRAILSALHFKCDLKNDLLVAKAKMAPPGEMLRILTRLGELVAFTRQLDVRMTDDASIERFLDMFRDRCRREEARS